MYRYYYVLILFCQTSQVTLPIFSAYLEGHANNAHCLASAVNTVLCALFALAGRRDTEERLKEFLAVGKFIPR